jgi:hypothetical protein
MVIEPVDQDESYENAPRFIDRLIELFIHPSRYFANDSNMDHQPTVFIAAISIGVAGVISKIDEKIVQFELSKGLGHPNKGLENTLPWVLESWLNYWFAAVAFGLLGSVIYWYLGGWWYKKRLQWSGAVGANPIKARCTNAIQGLVAAGPVVLLALFQTVLFSNYLEAWKSDEIWSSSVLIFVFWSCWVSYIASTTAFPTSKVKARVWFLILPVSLNLVALGAIGTLYAIFVAKGA